MHYLSDKIKLDDIVIQEISRGGSEEDNLKLNFDDDQYDYQLNISIF